MFNMVSLSQGQRKISGMGIMGACDRVCDNFVSLGRTLPGHGKMIVLMAKLGMCRNCADLDVC